MKSMNLISNQDFLPGVITQIASEYSNGYDTSQFGTTEPVVIIGTAFDGPVGVPVPIYNPEHARVLFGKSYDNRTRREATLTAEIQNAHQKGNRTIYGVRISGKEVSKEYNFAMNTSYKLKVSSAFPSNESKDFFMVYDDRTGVEEVRIYKPSSRATIREKMEGMVESDTAVMVTRIHLGRDHGFSKDSSLIEVMETINSNASNNVIRLSIVDQEGREINESSLDARGIALGSILPGLYTIGRDKNFVTAITQTEYRVISDEYDEFDNVPFEGFTGNILKEILINTDVQSGYPIYAKNIQDLREILSEKDVIMIEPYDFLETQGIIDRAFGKDKEDYEEVDISKFEMYKRLGSGFAETAKIVLTAGGNVKRVPAPHKDPNRIQELNDGIYSMLENNSAKFRVLSCGNADDKLEDNIPALNKFRITNRKEATIFEDLMQVTSRVRSNDYTEAKEYAFKIQNVSDEYVESLTKKIKASLYTEQAFQVISTTDDIKALEGKQYSPGMLILEKGAEKKLFRFQNGSFNPVTSAEIVGTIFVADKKFFKAKEGANQIVLEKIPANQAVKGNNFFLVQSNERIYIMELDRLGSFDMRPVGDIEGLFGEESDKTFVYVENLENHTNVIQIKSSALDMYTLEEFAEFLNQHPSLAGLFKFELTRKGLEVQHDYVYEAINNLSEKQFLVEFNKKFTSVTPGDDVKTEIYRRGYGDINKVKTLLKIEAADGSQVDFKDIFDNFEIATVKKDSDEKEFENIIDQMNGQVFELKKDWALTEGMRENIFIQAVINELAADGEFILTITDKDGENTISAKDFIIGIGTEVEVEEVLPKDIMPQDREITYDFNRYIPYRTSDNFARQLAQHCVYTSLKNSIPAHGFIGCSTLNDVSMNGISRKIDELLEKEYDLYAKKPNGRNMLDRSNMPYPIGRAVSITFQQDMVIMDDGYRYISNGASGYAGMVSTLPLDQSSTNQPIQSVNPMFSLSNYQLGKLTQKGYVTIKNSFSGDLVITDGVTMASPASPFRRFSVSRIIGAVEEILREASEPFIGKQNNAANRNSLQTAIKSKLDQIKGTLIENYDFKMIQDPRIAKFSYIEIDYRIVPIYEIREVRNKVTVKEEL